MTGGTTSESDAMQKAIADLEEMKRRRAQEAESGAPKRRGRPPRAAATEVASVPPEPTDPSEPTDSPEPVQAAPAKRGRKTRAPAPETGQPSFGVGQLTAHRPLGLLEVQEKTDLDALLADPRLAGHIATRLDDRFALVLPANLEKLQAALLKVGHTPKLQAPKLQGPGAPDRPRGKV